MSSKAKYMVKHIPLSPVTGKKLTFVQRGVLEQLADDHVEDRGRAFVSVGDIAKRMDIMPKNVRIHLKALEREQVIESRACVSEDGRIRLPNQYRFWFDPPFDEATTRRTEKLLEIAAIERASAPKQMTFDPLPESGGGVDPESGEGTPEIGGGVLPISGEGSPLNTNDLRERENARARTEAANDGATDLKPLAVQIVLSHPYAILRNWSAADIPVAFLVAVVEAIKAEIPPPDSGRGGTPETGSGSPQMEAALKLLHQVERIAREVPRTEWRFLKSLDKFMRLREYRMDPSELYHAEPKRGSRDGSPKPDSQPKPASSPAVQRGVSSRDNVDAAVERLRRRNPR